MWNYVKSELYRVVHSKGVYMMTAICTALLLAMNLLLAFIRSVDTTFPYGGTWFSFNMMETAIQPIMMLTVVLGCIIFADEYKNKTIMNSIAFGQTGAMVFVGKVIVALIVSVVALAVVLTVFIGSAYLLLENSGTEHLMELLKAFGACILFLVCGLVATIAFCFLLGSASSATWAWLGVFAFVPMIVQLLGMKFPLFEKLSGWLAYALAGKEDIILSETGEITGYAMIWTTPEGLQRCLLVGAIGIVVFLAVGILGMKKREIK